MRAEPSSDERRALLPGHPVIDLFLGLILAPAVALLELAFHLLTVPGDPRDVVVSEFAPLLFDLAADLFPVPSIQSQFIGVSPD